MKSILLFILLINCTMKIENFKQYENSSNMSDNIIYFSGFVDERSGNNTEGKFKAFIPFFIFGSTEMYFPEYDILSSGANINYYFYHGLRNNLKFKNKKVNLVFSNSSDINRKNSILSGNLKEYRCQRNQYLYGLSFLGVFLYYFGFPIISYECYVEIDLIFIENRLSKEKTLKKTYNTYVNMYKDIYMSKNLHMSIVSDLSRETEELIFKDN